MGGKQNSELGRTSLMIYSYTEKVNELLAEINHFEADFKFFFFWQLQPANFERMRESVMNVVLMNSIMDPGLHNSLENTR